MMAVQGLFTAPGHNGCAGCQPFEGDYLVRFVRGGECGRYLLFNELFNVL